MSDLKFSVSMCVYGKDNPEWFDRALDSVINQTIKPTELVLVVDGPIPDEIEKVIEKYRTLIDFKIIRFSENQGHGNARRAGFEGCSYDLIALMDADDVSVPDRFEEQLKIFAEQDVDIVGGDISEFIGEEENIVAYRNVPTTDAEIKEYLKKRCPFNQQTVMFKKEAVEDVGGYIDWYCEEDYYLWIRLARKGYKMMNTGTILANVRVGKEMYSRRGGLKYFKSEKRLQKYMRKNKIIGFGTYFSNVTKRFIVQVLLPNKLRGWVFKKFARKKV